MYTILVVDDEPLICKGLSALLTTSGIDITAIHTAHNGYEALDCLRSDDIDLLVTDIQMGTMNGIELMQQAKMIKPWVETIIISAHETFQYAQMALRLGAKDYLIKPLNGDQFLDTVRNVLLKMRRPEPAGQEEILAKLQDHFRMEAPMPQSAEWLKRLIADPVGSKELIARLSKQYHIRLEGPYFSFIRIQLKGSMNAKEAPLSTEGLRLLQYAALNITNELLAEQWNHTAFYASDEEIGIIVQWSEEQYAEAGAGKLNELDMIGRSLYFNIHKFLGISSLIGISQILKGIEFLDQLNEQAVKALLCSTQHPDHYVFYYGDFNWSLYPKPPSEEEVSAQTSMIVEKAKAYIHVNYNQKGLTLHEVAHSNHVSPNYLSYLFKKEVGSNLWEYVIKLRMEEGRRLLLQTDMRRYEISEKVGYESPEHFSKIFKKYYGISPSELKK